MLDISFDGHVVDGVGAPLAGAYIQPFFSQVLSGSSPDTWGPVLAQTGADGYFQFNLGDGTFLTQDGAAGDDDKVLLCVWYGSTDVARLGLLKTHFSFMVVTIAGDTHTGLVVHVLLDREPTTAFSVPASTPRLTNMTLTNTCTDEVTVGDDQQKNAYLGEEIFDAVGVAFMDVDWGDLSVVERLAGTANGVHQYAVDGGTTVTVSGLSQDVRGNDSLAAHAHDVNVLWREPLVDLAWDPLAPTCADTVTFSPLIIDLEVGTAGAVSTVDYLVDGVQEQTGLGVSEQWAHQFVANGSHTVELRAHWHDGFAAQVASVTETVIVANQLPTAAFTTTGTGVGAYRVVWDAATSSDPEGPIANYSWVLEASDGLGGWLPEATGAGAGMVQFAYAFAYNGEYRMSLTVTDQDGGTDTVSEPVTVTTTGGGGATIIFLPISSD